MRQTCNHDLFGKICGYPWRNACLPCRYSHDISKISSVALGELARCGRWTERIARYPTHTCSTCTLPKFGGVRPKHEHMRGERGGTWLTFSASTIDLQSTARGIRKSETLQLSTPELPGGQF